MPKHDHNNKYSTVEVCAQKHGNVDERCKTRVQGCYARFSRAEKDILQDAADIRGINRKINATLIFAVATLLMIIIGIVMSRF